MTLNKVKEDKYYLLIESTQDSNQDTEELKEKFNKEQKLEMKFERFDLPLIMCFWPIM